VNECPPTTTGAGSTGTGTGTGTGTRRFICTDILLAVLTGECVIDQPASPSAWMRRWFQDFQAMHETARGIGLRVFGSIADRPCLNFERNATPQQQLATSGQANNCKAPSRVMARPPFVSASHANYVHSRELHELVGQSTNYFSSLFRVVQAEVAGACSCVAWDKITLRSDMMRSH
jgi:hypothetical protein